MEAASARLRIREWPQDVTRQERSVEEGASDDDLDSNSQTSQRHSAGYETIDDATQQIPNAKDQESELDAVGAQLSRLQLSEVPSATIAETYPADELGITEAERTAFKAAMQKAASGTGGFVNGLASHDVRLLDHDEWLNDEIVNAYLKLLQGHSTEHPHPKCHFFNSFFLQQLLKSDGYEASCARILECDLIFFPYFSFSHWSLILADLRSNTLTHYDSMQPIQDLTQPQDCVREVMSTIVAYLVQEAMDKCGEDWSGRAFEFCVAQDVPQQSNGSDCGVFVTQFAKYLSLNRPLTFSPSQIFDARIQIFKELSKNIIIAPTRVE